MNVLQPRERIFEVVLAGLLRRRIEEVDILVGDLKFTIGRGGGRDQRAWRADDPGEKSTSVCGNLVVFFVHSHLLFLFEKQRLSFIRDGEHFLFVDGVAMENFFLDQQIGILQTLGEKQRMRSICRIDAEIVS